jgi:pterin-4a-carbinolamine dehydratase
MKILADAKDDVSTHINEFRALQQEWKSIGQVPPSSLSELFKQYNAYQEAFWDLIKINNELREYDFKKNLEAKIQICEAAEKLMDEPDVVTAFQHLQKLHNEWHEIGPVSRELREEIWQRFKNASTAINKKHQTYFESIRKIEEDNLAAKTALCEKIESIDFSVLKTFSEWEEATKNVLALQDEWRTIGFAPRKLNQKVFERYRHACDAFFSAKAEFFKQVRNSYAENYRKKVELCENAESLKDNTDWKETSEKFIQLQKEWKAIGPVPRKYSDELWKRFISACDYFFDQKKKNTNSLHGEELENLEKKKNLIARINSLKKSDHPNETVATLKALIEEWSTIGHVPFKEKDKVYKDFRAAVDKKYEELNIDWVSRRLETFKNNLKDMNTKGQRKLIHERDKLLHARERLNSEIATYENNLGYFTSTTQKGSKVILELERKIDTLKEESRLIEEKIRLIEDNL